MKYKRDHENIHNAWRKYIKCWHRWANGYRLGLLMLNITKIHETYQSFTYISRHITLVIIHFITHGSGSRPYLLLCCFKSHHLRNYQCFESHVIHMHPWIFMCCRQLFLLPTITPAKPSPINLPISIFLSLLVIQDASCESTHIRPGLIHSSTEITLVNVRWIYLASLHWIYLASLLILNLSYFHFVLFITSINFLSEFFTWNTGHLMPLSHFVFVPWTLAAIPFICCMVWSITNN